jgi:hypothetical protein
MARTELEQWKAENPHVHATPEEFEPIRAGLAGVSLADIMAATGCSKSAASQWRSGRYVPAIRHWPALAGLVGVTVDDVLGAEQI